MRSRILSGLLVVGAVLVTRIAGGQRSSPSAPSSSCADALERGLAVYRLQAYSDYIGFEGRFGLADRGTTITMSGGELCGDDFPDLIPPPAWNIVVSAGFERFRCDGKGVHSEIRLSPRHH